MVLNVFPKTHYERESVWEINLNSIEESLECEGKASFINAEGSKRSEDIEDEISIIQESKTNTKVAISISQTTYSSFYNNCNSQIRMHINAMLQVINKGPKKIDALQGMLLTGVMPG